MALLKNNHILLFVVDEQIAIVVFHCHRKFVRKWVFSVAFTIIVTATSGTGSKDGNDDNSETHDAQGVDGDARLFDVFFWFWCCQSCFWFW